MSVKYPAMAKLTKPCKHCGVSYHVKPSHANGSSYCSRTCKNEALRTHPKIEARPCCICGSLFTPARKGWAVRHCSKKCEWISRGGSEFNRRIAREGAVKNRASQKRLRPATGRSYPKDHGRHEHRRVAEDIIGRPLLSSEVVHHKDHNKLNNDPSNLEVMSRQKHMREHGLGIPGIRPKGEPWKYRWRKHGV